MLLIDGSLLQNEFKDANGARPYQVSLYDSGLAEQSCHLFGDITAHHLKVTALIVKLEAAEWSHPA
jgi:hypothetical protein